MDEHMPIKDRIQVRLKYGDIFGLTQVLEEYKNEWCDNSGTYDGFNGKSDLIHQLEEEIEEIYSPEFELENYIYKKLKNLAITIDISNKMAHYLRDNVSKSHGDAASIRGRILMQVKDILMQQFCTECIESGIKCGMYEDDRDGTNAFGAFIPGIGEVGWHLGNRFSADAMRTTMERAIMINGVRRSSCEFHGRLSNLDYSNMNRLLGDVKQREYNQEVEKWGIIDNFEK